MLMIEDDLPTGALLPDLGPSLEDVVRTARGQWFCFEEPFIERSNGKIDLILPRTGSASLTPIVANEGKGDIANTNGISYYAGRTGKNCGLALARPLPCTSLSLAAILIAPDPDTRTITGIDRTDGNASFYFSASETGITLGQRKADAEVTLPYASDTKVDLIYLTLGPSRIAMSRGDGSTHESKLETPLADSPFEIFVGCRRQAAGLLRTLGTIDLADLFVLPGTDILAPRSADLRAAIELYRAEAFANAV